VSEYETLAAVDLGSNSFHCQIARVVGDQVYPLDSLREPIRLGAGLNAEKMLDDISQDRALACLHRFGERLRGFDKRAVRALGTNTLRVAKNGRQFLRRAQAALGFPIEVIAGREEARLIYVGVTHSLPASKDRRLVVDIGGGSTEFIVGTGYKPQKLESLFMGCVSYSVRYFPDGRITKSAMKEAELAARAEIEPIVSGFARRNWDEALGSSGTARALADILQVNGWSDGGITPDGLELLRGELVRAGDVAAAPLQGLKPDRIPVLPGGLAIMSAVLRELAIDRMTVASGAMRQGVLYDLFGRVHHKDMRDVTVAQFMQRYHVDVLQARRVSALACRIYEKIAGGSASEESLSYLGWAAKLHEIGISVAYSGYHKHAAYILSNADMPGFSRDEQNQLALLALAHRRSLKKILPQIEGQVDLDLVFALRLAALFCRGRSDIVIPVQEARAQAGRYRLALDAAWLERNPLSATALHEEVREWEKLGISVKVPGLGAPDTGVASLAQQD
jgi:exopolyphosphatase/guanosine-5'-triphosphate,3'-diphosphate pyrophosphatase